MLWASLIPSLICIVKYFLFLPSTPFFPEPPHWLRDKESACNAGDIWDAGSSFGQEDPLEEQTATHSRILAWEIPWTEEPGRVLSMGSQRVRQDWATEHTWPLNSSGFILNGWYLPGSSMSLYFSIFNLFDFTRFCNYFLGQNSRSVVWFPVMFIQLLGLKEKFLF